MQLSVLIPTINEEARILPLISFLKKYGGDQIKEIIVCDGGSSDQTVSVVKASGVKVVQTLKCSRASQMNAGAHKATGDLLYFLHADAFPVKSFVSDIQNAAVEGYDAGCFRYQFDQSSALLKINAFFNRFNLAGMSGGGDQSLFITKNAFEKLNGFDEQYCIMEDFEIVKRIRKSYSFVIIPKSMVVSARKYRENNWLKIQIANFLVFAMFAAHRSPEKMKSFYKKMIH